MLIFRKVLFGRDFSGLFLRNRAMLTDAQRGTRQSTANTASRRVTSEPLRERVYQLKGFLPPRMILAATLNKNSRPK